MVEFVDLYPTLCELCQIPQPAEQLDGQSFAKVFSNLKAKTKDEVYIQWEGGDNAVDQRFSYAEWMKGDVKKASMLFDHRIDEVENKIEFIEVKRQSKNFDEDILRAKSEAFIKTVGSFRGYEFELKGLSMEDM